MIDNPGVVPALAQALAKRGYDALTAVQQAVLAEEADGRDALVSAQTGSGKTVAFGLALARTLLGRSDRFGRPDAPLALVVAPTRELALQVREEFRWLFAEAGGVVASCVGGMDPRAERRALERGAHLVVGTPGRLRDHIERRALDMRGLRAVVLDEADEMLDMGFREDLEFILDAAPEERRTLLFSATVPRGIAALAKRFQRDALRIEAAEESRQHGDIDYQACTVAPSDRENAVYNLLRLHGAESALVFCATRAAVGHMAARFSNRGVSVVALSGELSQNERTHALQAMRDGRAQVCIATDVAARGIDLPKLDLVVHADLPSNPETLLHRSGRTGRAGRKGVTALIVPVNARRKAQRLLAGAGIEATWSAPPSPAEILARDDARILEDPALAAAVDETEAEMVAALLERHGPEGVAAAFLRRMRSGLAAPEDLTDVSGPRPPKARPRDDGPMVWFALSVGREQRAEARWLLPMICGATGLGRGEVGAIRIEGDRTHVQIAEHRAEAFLAALGPGDTLEKGVTVSRSDGPSEGARRDDPRPGRVGSGKAGRSREGARSRPTKKRR